MSKEQLPFERDFTRDMAEAWCEGLSSTRLTWSLWSSDQQRQIRLRGCRTYEQMPYEVKVGGGPDTSWDALWREAIAGFCAKARLLPPWRPEPDLSSVEECIRTITETPGVTCINFYPADGYVPIEVQFAAVGTKRYGERSAGWTLELLQEVALDVLGMAATPAE